MRHLPRLARNASGHNVTVMCKQDQRCIRKCTLLHTHAAFGMSLELSGAPQIIEIACNRTNEQCCSRENCPLYRAPLRQMVRAYFRKRGYHDDRSKPLPRFVAKTVRSPRPSKLHVGLCSMLLVLARLFTSHRERRVEPCGFTTRYMSRV